MDTARIVEILTDPVTLDLVERQPIMQIVFGERHLLYRPQTVVEPV